MGRRTFRINGPVAHLAPDLPGPFPSYPTSKLESAHANALKSMPALVNDQEVVVVERRLGGGPSPSRLELGLRNQMLEIDKHIAVLHIEEYRRLMGAYLGGGVLAAEPLIGRPPAEPGPRAIIPGVTPCPCTTSRRITVAGFGGSACCFACRSACGGGGGCHWSETA